MSDIRTDRDWLDTLLRQESDYIADAGFTARVLSALPKTRQRWYASRSFVLLAATVMACVAAFFIPGLPAYVIGSLTDLVTLQSFSPDKLAVLIPIALLYWTGLSAAAEER